MADVPNYSTSSLFIGPLLPTDLTPDQVASLPTPGLKIRPKHRPVRPEVGPKRRPIRPKPAPAPRPKPKPRPHSSTLSRRIIRRLPSAHAMGKPAPLPPYVNPKSAPLRSRQTGSRYTDRLGDAELLDVPYNQLQVEHDLRQRYTGHRPKYWTYAPSNNRAGRINYAYNPFADFNSPAHQDMLDHPSKLDYASRPAFRRYAQHTPMVYPERVVNPLTPLAERREAARRYHHERRQYREAQMTPNRFIDDSEYRVEAAEVIGRAMRGRIDRDLGAYERDRLMRYRSASNYINMRDRHERALADWHNNRPGRKPPAKPKAKVGARPNFKYSKKYSEKKRKR